MRNLILNTDSYKASHFLQYPPRTAAVNSYIEARPVAGFDEVVFFGLQMFIQEYLMTPITRADIDEAEEVLTAHGLPFNRVGWEIIVDEYAGYLPVVIEALPEGSVVPTGTPLVQVRNVDHRLAWLPGYIETMLLRAVWYPSTVATNSREVKKTIWKYLEETCDDPAGQIDFKLHDFGARGTAAYEQAGIGGCAHLVNFKGTDTLTGLLYARDYYGEPMAGFSIPAAEHSTITSWGQDREEQAYRNMLQQFPTGLVAVVSDSYDIEHAVKNLWGRNLKAEVLDRNGVLVVRPDSGDPVEQVINTLQSLAEAYSVTKNSKGYDVLNPKVRVIQGDGVDAAEIGHILNVMKACGWSAENVAFGMGAGLLQHVNRDTLRFAMKASAIQDDDGVWRGVNKMPKTDPGKASKRGIQYVWGTEGTINVVGLEKLTVNHPQWLETAYAAPPHAVVREEQDVPYMRHQSFADVRDRAKIV